MTRWKLIAVGAFFTLMWFASSAVTVVPGTVPSTQWIAQTAFAFLAGAAFGTPAILPSTRDKQND